MSITTNSNKGPDVALARRYIKALGKKANETEARLNFKGDELEFIENDNRYLLDRPRFSAWLDAGLPRAGSGAPDFNGGAEATEAAAPTPEPEAKPKAKRAPRKRKPKPKPEPEPEPEPEPVAEAVPQPEPLADDIDKALEQLANEAWEIESQQLAGETGSNVARYRRGLLVMKLDQVRDKAKTEGRKELATRKALLDLVNRRQIAIADGRNMLDRFKPITEDEASVTSKVVDTFLGGDLTARFRMVDAINPLTGEPWVNDAGEPPDAPITDIAINKLQPLLSHVTSDNFHSLLSFAHRYSEKTVKDVVKLAAKVEKPVEDMVSELNAKRRPATSDITGEPIDVQFNDDDVKVWLKDLTPPPPPSEYFTITTTRAWAEAVWVPMRNVVSKINEVFRFSMPNEETGDVSNVLLLERTISQFFDVREPSGFNRVLGALHQAGDLTDEQATFIMTNFTYDPETETLRELTDEEKEAEQDRSAEPAAEPTPSPEPEPDADSMFDDDLDIDELPEPEEPEGDEEGDDPEDF